MGEKLFQRTYGEQNGLKTQDIEAYAELLGLSGFDVHGGRVIGVEAFNRLEEELGMSKMDEMDRRTFEAPDWIVELNRWILSCLLKKEMPYIFRSDALADRGGNGIYESDVFVALGDDEKDLERMWQIERGIFTSEFSESAKKWREKEGKPIGMAIAIQKMIGEKHGQYFYPILSGTAFTSWRGKPTVNVVFGLGGGVSQGTISASFKESVDLEKFMIDMNRQERIEVVDLERACWTSIEIEKAEIDITDILPLRVNELLERLGKLKEKGAGDFYLEWALANESSQINVVQVAPFNDVEGVPIEIDPTGKTLLASGTDIVNHGRKICQYIVWASEFWNQGTVDIIASLNSQLKNYLLIVPPEAFSIVDQVDLLRRKVIDEFQFKHFSNASVVLENQRKFSIKQKESLRKIGIVTTDHAENQGGMHFQQICLTRDILFLGTNFDLIPLFDLKNGTDYPGGVRVFDTDVEAVNDYTKNMGYVFIVGEPKIIEYSPRQIDDFTFALRDVVNELNDEDRDLANWFYQVHYAICPWINNPNGFDPFELDPEELNQKGWRKGTLLEAIDKVLENGLKFVNPNLWEGIEEYLIELKQKLLEKPT